MIENRINLNKRIGIKKEKIEGLIIGEYRKNTKTPNFMPDLCLCSWGDIIKCSPCTYTKETWFKTDNKELLDFIRNYNWNSIQVYKNSAKSMPIYMFKKIILKEFYGFEDAE